MWCEAEAIASASLYVYTFLHTPRAGMLHEGCWCLGV